MEGPEEHSSLAALLDRALAGDGRSAARLMTLLESDVDATPAIMSRIYPLAGHAQVIGVTGPPGAGKSSLVDKLAAAFRAQGKTVGIVAVDPSSPFTGGALLGDRIRMQGRFSDPGVFIRSMASRGQPGGLAKASQNVVALMAATGKDTVIIETVGVGQEEIDVVRVADTTVVVLVPGLGDAVQTMKAGLLEAADVFAVNKADYEGAERLVKDLELMLHLGSSGSAWSPPIVKTIATEGSGVDQLVGSLAGHFDYLQGSGEYLKRRRRAAVAEIDGVLRGQLMSAIARRVPAFDVYASQVAERKCDPYTAADRILRESGLTAEGLG